MTARWGLVCILLCLGASTAAAGTITANPPTTAFGNVSVSAGATSSTVTLTNSGTSTSISSLMLGPGCQEFTATAAGLPGTLMNGASLTVNVTYDPNDRIADTCTVTVVDGNPNDTFTLTGDGIAPELSVTPLSLTFADQPWNTGTGQTLNVTINNVGDEPISSTDISAVLTTGTEFSLGNITGLPIAPGTSGTLAVTFDPTSGGPKTDTVTISLTTDSPGDPDPTVMLSGNGLTLVGTPSPLDFGTVQVGSSLDKTLTITNTGTTTANVNTITSGDSAFTYTVVGNPLPRALAPAESMQVTVTFTPVNGNVISADLTIATDTTPSSLVVPMTGDGLYLAVTIAITDETSAMIDLGNLRVGTATTRHVTVTNAGENAVSLTMPSSSDTHCALSLTAPTTYPASVAPASTATFDIVTTPTAVGAGACTITIASDIPSTDTIDIQWTGIAPDVQVVTPTSASIGYGVVDVDASPDLRNVILKNTGSAPMTVSGCTLSGSSQFIVMTDCSQLPQIAPLESVTIPVAFDPVMESTETAILAIAVDAISTSEVDVTLLGVGGDQRIDIPVTTISFPDTIVNPAPPPNVRFTVHNPLSPATNSGVPLTISMVSSDQTVFEVTNPGPFTLDPDGNQELAVLFRPQTIGMFSGTLTIMSDASSTPMAQLAMSGRGIADPTEQAGGCCQANRDASGSFALAGLVGLVLRRRRRRAS
jgi:MYXO-CTERM domain-containing protein